MRKYKMVVFAVILVVILVGVEIFVIRAASGYEPEVEVVFARVKIPEETVITRDMLEVRMVGLGVAQKLAVKKPEDVTGKRAKMDIEDGEMMLLTKAGSLEDMEKLKVKDKNKRLYTVEFKADQANGWWILADQNVDIIFVSEEADNNTVNRIQKLKNIRIAALIDERGKLLKNNDRVTLPRYISFEVTEEQVDFLTAAKSRGRIELSVIPGE